MGLATHFNKPTILNENWPLKPIAPSSGDRTKYSVLYFVGTCHTVLSIRSTHYTARTIMLCQEWLVLFYWIDR